MSQLATHYREQHEGEAKDVCEKTEGGPSVKRSLSPGKDESEHEVKKKKESQDGPGQAGKARPGVSHRECTQDNRGSSGSIKAGQYPGHHRSDCGQAGSGPGESEALLSLQPNQKMNLGNRPSA